MASSLVVMVVLGIYLPLDKCSSIALLDYLSIVSLLLRSAMTVRRAALSLELILRCIIRH
ncbi:MULTISPECIES: hypothetical protein [unclassified Microcoleus]